MKRSHDGERLEFQPIDRYRLLSNIDCKLVPFVRDCDRAFRKCGKRRVVKWRPSSEVLLTLQSWSLKNTQSKCSYPSEATAGDGVYPSLSDALQCLVIDSWRNSVGPSA